VPTGLKRLTPFGKSSANAWRERIDAKRAPFFGVKPIRAGPKQDQGSETKNECRPRRRTRTRPLQDATTVVYGLG
jgi:hypothetical protein